MAGNPLIGGGKGYFRPGAYDDMFEDSASLAAKWTQTGIGGTIHKDINTTKPGALYLQAACMQPAPTAPYTILAKCAEVDWDAGPGVGNSSICIAQAAPGPYYFAGVDVGVSGTMVVGSSKFDSSGNFVTNPQFLSPVSGFGYAIPHVLKMRINSSTSTDVYISFDDGVTWTTICTAYNFGITPNYIGLANGGSRSTWAWFRVI